MSNSAIANKNPLISPLMAKTLSHIDNIDRYSDSISIDRQRQLDLKKHKDTVIPSISKQPSKKVQESKMVEESQTPFLDQFPEEQKEFMRTSRQRMLLDILITDGYEIAYSSAFKEEEEFITKYKRASLTHIEEDREKLDAKQFSNYVPEAFI